MSRTIDTVADVISTICGIQVSQIQSESHVIDDLGVDSVDFLDVIYELDRRLQVKIPIDQWTEEINAGRASTADFFVMEKLASRIDQLVAAR